MNKEPKTAETKPTGQEADADLQSIPSWLTPALVSQIEEIAGEIGPEKARQLNQTGELVKEAERRVEQLERDTVSLSRSIMENKQGTSPMQAMAEATEAIRAARRSQTR